MFRIRFQQVFAALAIAAAPCLVAIAQTTPAPGRTAEEQMRALRAELAAVRGDLTQTRQLLDEAKTDLAAAKSMIEDDPDIRARFELWRREHQAVEVEQRALQREKLKLGQAQDNLGRTLRADEQRAADDQAAIERARRQPTTVEPPIDVNYRQPSTTFNTGYYGGYYPIIRYGPWPWPVYQPNPPYRGPIAPRSPTAPTRPTTPRTPIQQSSDAASDPTRTPMMPQTIVIDSTVTGSPRAASLEQLRAEYEHLKARYPSQYRPDNSAYRVSDNPRQRTPNDHDSDRLRVYQSTLTTPAPTTGRTLTNTETQHYETRYPSESRGDNSRYRVSDK